MNDRDFGRLSRELDALFELSNQARAERLAVLRAQDPAFADELERILAADADSGLLDEGIANAAPTVMERLATAEDDSRAVVAEAGRRIDHYRLVERVGSGGMGEVWAGERIDDFEQKVAIKLIRPLLDGPQLRERFARERRILARLDHPNIARLLDGGVTEDGTPWYAMEFVHGKDLIRYAQDKALDVRARVDLLLQVCDAAAHAHTQLVVHRDLKPSNVLVDAEGRARVLDFGIARLLDDTANNQLTGTGVRVFSPAYAAPEQIRGDMVGTPADVFALGAVLYELLTGQVPHPQRTSSPDRLIASLEDEGAPRPSETNRKSDGAPGRMGERITRQSGALDSDLDTIVATALQPDPARRYAGAAQLADDLRRWLDGRPIAARPDTATYRMRKFVARHRIAVGSASAVLLALIAGFGTALWQANVAREQAQRATAEAAKATAIKDFLLASFNTAQIGEKTQAEGASTTVLQLIETSAKGLLADEKLDAEVRLELLTALGELLRINGLIEQAEPLQLEALAIARLHYGARSEKYVYAMVERATSLSQIGRDDESNRLFDEAIALMEDAGQQHTESYPFALWMRGVGAYGENRLDEALGLFERAEAACIEYRPTDSTRASALQWQANVLQLRDRFDAAEAAVRRSLPLAQASERPEEGEGLARLYLGDLLSREGQYADALDEYERALGFMREADAGGRNPDRAVLLSNTARARYELGQRAEALSDVQSALEIARLHPGGPPGRTLEDRAQTALLVMHLGEADAAAALPLARELAARWAPDSTDPVYAGNQTLLAEAELLGGDVQAARAAAERAVAIRNAIDPDTLATRQSRLVFAEALERLGDAAALKNYQDVLTPAHADATTQPAPSRSLQRARALAGLARLSMNSDPQAAARHVREGLALLPEPRYTSERRLHGQLQALETSVQ